MHVLNVFVRMNRLEYAALVYQHKHSLPMHLTQKYSFNHVCVCVFICLAGMAAVHHGQERHGQCQYVAVDGDEQRAAVVKLQCSFHQQPRRAVRQPPLSQVPLLYILRWGQRQA